MRIISPAEPRHARHIGRVGALAVALGVGMAVATSPGIALADNGDGSENTSETTPDNKDDSDTGPESEPDQESQAVEESEPDDADVADVEESTDPDVDDDPDVDVDVDVDDDPDVDDTPPPAEDLPDQGGSHLTENQPVNEPPVDENDEASSTREDAQPPEYPAIDTISTEEVGTKRLATEDVLTAESDKPVAPMETFVAPLALTTAEAAAPVDPQLREAVNAVEDLVLDAASVFVTAALAPFVLFNPLSPQPPQTLWVVLLWVRRELQRTFDNDAPTLSYTGDTTRVDDETLTGTVTANDPDGDPFEVSTTNSAAGGVVTIDDDGNFTYHAPSDWDGEELTDTFTVTAVDSGSHLHGLLGLFDDDGGHATTYTVTVTLPAANDTPTAGDPPYEITDIDEITGEVTGVVTVIDDDTDLTFELATPIDETLGEVSVDAETGAWTYKPTGQARLDAHRTTESDVVAFSIIATDPSGQTVTIDLDDVPIDPAEAAVTSIVDVGGAPGGVVLSPDGRYAYVVEEGSDRLTVVDTESPDAEPVMVEIGGAASGYVGISPSGDRVYVTHETGITVVNTADNTTGELVTVPSGQQDIKQIIVSPDGTHLYVVRRILTQDDDQLLRVTAAGLVRNGVDAAGLINDVEVIDNTSVVAVSSNTVLVVRFTSGPTTFTVPGNLRGVAVSGNQAYITDFDANVVKVVDLTDGSVDASIAVGDSPASVAVHGDRLYVANTGDGTVSVIDVANHVVLETIKTGPVTDLAVSSDGEQIYATVTETGEIVVITSVHSTTFDALEPGL